jgi:hypothetical protein
VDGRTRNLLAASLALVIIVTGGAAILLGEDGASGLGDIGDPSPSDSQSVIGVIVAVESEGIDKVRGFTMRTEGESTIDFVIGSLEDGGAFPPGHLVEHQATAQRVRVWYRVEGETTIAVRLEDAE